MKNLKFADTFLSTYPCLYLGIFFLLGIAAYFYENLIYLIFLVFIWNKKSLFFAISAFSLAFAYCYFNFSDLKQINSEITGTAKFEIKSIKESYYFNRKSYLYQGNLVSFRTDKNEFKNIPCSVSSKKKYSSDHTYVIPGQLIATRKYNYQLKSKAKWVQDKKITSITNLRFDLKKKFHQILKKIINDKNGADFLHTLLTGDNTHKLLTFNFSKIGLQHVLAISGFHFGVLTIFFSSVLRCFFSPKTVAFLLIIIVNLYFLFVGPLVSVERSYIMILMALSASLINRKYFALNSIGASMIVILILNPLNIANIGFQLSYLSTFAILLGFTLTDDYFDKFIKKRSEKEINELDWISKILEKILNFIRQSICLSLVVNIFIIPVVLFHFHKFAFLGFIYNLFIPFLVGICMMMVIFALIFYFTFPQIGYVINYISTYFTKFILMLSDNPPANLQIYLRSQSISFEFVIIYLALVGLLFLILKHSNEEKITPKYLDLF
ncbi:MAG: ComEC/Rec2 family competence protein [Parachlamydiales bacterium]|jgi:competence protein ComEC